MIPELFITEWRKHAPWPSTQQVEQDLLLSRALVEIYSDKELRSRLAFRGGTALHKLMLPGPLRYSEDLDFIQVDAEAIGVTLDGIRARLDPWLGKPKREFGEGLVKLLYRFRAESDSRPMKLKIEINSREHFAARNVELLTFSVKSEWFTGESQLLVIRSDWMLGSKLRALYQRRKGRDLFDLYVALQHDLASAESVVSAFLGHLEHQGLRISRADFERNMFYKLQDTTFLEDLPPLLTSTSQHFNLISAYEYLHRQVISLLPGEPWKGEKD